MHGTDRGLSVWDLKKSQKIASGFLLGVGWGAVKESKHAVLK